MATPKSTKERIFRQLRHDTKHRDHGVHSKMPKQAILAKVGKTGDNDPHSNRPRLHNEIPEDLKMAVIFLKNNFKKTGSALTDAVIRFKATESLKKLVNHLIATSRDGWQQSQDDGRPCFVSESGQTAYPENWVLVDGKLQPKGSGFVLSYDIDVLVDIKRIIESIEYMPKADNPDIFHYALKLRLGQCIENDIPQELREQVYQLAAD